MSKKVLGIIPAKGASTRLKRKNVRFLGGRSLLQWAGDAARDSSVFDRLIVSTEDKNIAAEANSLGLETPFLRPTNLAVDPAGVVQVALHALEELEAQGETYQTLCIMLPTCPFRTAEDIKNAYGLFASRSEPNLMSISEFDHTPFAAYGLDDNGIALPHFSDYIDLKSQEMPPAYRPNGAIHILDVEWFRQKKSYSAPPILAYVMPRNRSVDIDTEDDLRIAELMLLKNDRDNRS